MTFDEVVDFYNSATTHRSKDRDQYSLLRLQPHFTGKAIADIKRVHLREYIRVRRLAGVQDSTINRELRFFSAAVNFARFELELDFRNPLQHMLLDEPEGRVRWITTAEAVRLIAAADRNTKTPHLAQFIRLALNTGCRKSELLRLEWSRVDLTRHFIRLDAKHTKGGKRYLVPLNPAAMDAMRILRKWHAENTHGVPWVFTWPNGERIGGFRKSFATACEVAGLQDFHIHDMRHTCASWLVIAGVSLYVVRDLLGHSSVTTTERYAHLAPDQVASAVQLLLPV